MLKLFIDTDIGNDCDDAAAISLAFKYANQNLCSVECVTVNTRDEFAANCIDAISAFNGIDVEVGEYKGDGFEKNERSYCQKVARRFNCLNGKRRKEAVELIISKLQSCTDGEAKIVCIGQFNNLRLLLENKKGFELVKRKVSEVVLMGGMFGIESTTFEGQPYVAEFNVVTSVSDSKTAINLCPVPVTFCDFTLGRDVITLEKIVEEEFTNPVGYAYKIFLEGAKGRPSWDILAIMYAVKGLDGCFAYSKSGIVTVTDEGKTIHTQSQNGLHRYLLPAVECKALQEKIDELFIK